MSATACAVSCVMFVPAAQAALEAGVYDQSALTKDFKRWYGITPLQFVEASGACRRIPATDRSAAG